MIKFKNEAYNLTDNVERQFLHTAIDEIELPEGVYTI